MSGAKSCQGSVTRPEEATPPFFPLLHSGPQRRVTTVSPGFCRTALRLPPTTLSSHSRGCGQGPHRAASPKLSTLIPSPRPEFELQDACPPMTQRLERAGLASWGAEKRTHLEQSKGEQFLHALSAILEGRHRAPLRLFLLPLRRHHIRPGRPMYTLEALVQWTSDTGEARPDRPTEIPLPSILGPPAKPQTSRIRDLRSHSQRPACLPHSEHYGWPTVGISPMASGRAARHRGPLSRSQIVHCMLGLVVSFIILPFLRTPRVETACVLRLLAKGDFQAETDHPFSVYVPESSWEPPGFCLHQPTVA